MNLRNRKDASDVARRRRRCRGDSAEDKSDINTKAKTETSDMRASISAPIAPIAWPTLAMVLAVQLYSGQVHSGRLDLTPPYPAVEGPSKASPTSRWKVPGRAIIPGGWQHGFGVFAGHTFTFG